MKKTMGIALVVLFLATIAIAGPHDLVVLQPGGVSPSPEAQEQIMRLAKEIATQAGWDANSVSAIYFDETEPALAHIKTAKPGFVLGTLGFYLKYKDQLKLTMVNQILRAGQPDSRYYIVVTNDAIKSLDDLKGKTIAGVHFEEPEFIEKVVLQGKLPFSSVTVKPMRSLRALRRLATGKVDAVLLDGIEHKDLGSVPIEAKFQTIFTSEPIPNAGFMAIGGNATQADIQALQKALKNFCTQAEGAGICKDYNINGFRDIAPATYDKVKSLYTK